jgi:mannose/cellobiose epimerase-like protein (N-acyl-D-glucosamine 2-epimerase family)
MGIRKHSRCQFLMIVAFIFVLSSFSSLSHAVENNTDIADTYIPKLEKMLSENIVSFWLTKSPDKVNGGYTINFDSKGELKSGGTKMIVTQARMLWFFSHLSRTGHGGQECLEVADLGYKFLTEKMWDHENGGFFWEVDVTGDKKLQPNKHLYGQAFALYGISEYYLASNKPEALDFATKLFNLIDTKARDNEYGGYLESFDTAWKPLTPNISSYMGPPAGLKLMNTHLHLLEAFTSFYRASKLPLARQRLMELILIQSNTVVRKPLGACTDKYNRDWTPRLEAEYARISYGHDIENVWLLMDACEAAGLYNRPLLDFYKTLYNYSLKYGYDETNGGFFDSGPFNKPADRRTKIWWTQAEALISSLHMYSMTSDPKYLSVFKDTYDFVDKYIADWDNGEWYGGVTAEGTVISGDKGNTWKCGYHNGRAMTECIEILRHLKENKKM